MAAVFLFGFLISSFRLPGRIRAAQGISPDKVRAALVQPYDFAALLVMFVAFAVGLFYCLEALQGERRDRSILFWKSLPVSDVTTVLAKASIAYVFLPLLTFVIVIATQLIMLLWSSVVLLISGLSVSTLWSEVGIVRSSLMLLYHVVTGHMLWYAPIYAWLLLASAWARRLAFLWAALPLAAIGVVEKAALGTSDFGMWLLDRFLSDPGIVAPPGGAFPMSPMVHLAPAAFFGSSGLWIGLVLAAIFLAGAVRLRRLRGPG
jgi:ABC-2 type transport system permease protein